MIYSKSQIFDPKYSKMHNLAPNIPSLFHLYDIYTIHLAFFSFIMILNIKTKKRVSKNDSKYNMHNFA